MSGVEYKALTHVNLPFLDSEEGKGTGRRFKPGAMISHDLFEEYAELAAKNVPPNEEDDGGNVPTAQEVIEHMIQWGSISDDPDAPLHPDHLPVDPNKPTMARLVSQAQQLVEELQAAGADVPDELRQLAKVSDRQIEAIESGEGRDEVAKS